MAVSGDDSSPMKRAHCQGAKENLHVTASAVLERTQEHHGRKSDHQ